MKHRYAFLLSVCLCMLVGDRLKAQVVINEVMAQNSSTTTDPDYGESADWIELYNGGNEDVDLSGYFVTDNMKSPDKYALPYGTIVPAGGYILLWCDDHAVGLHTSFKLSADGESVALYTPDKELVDGITFDVQLMDVSYGRRKGNTDEWVYFSTPTPGSENSDDAFSGKANQPMILTHGGLYNGSVTVSITNDLGGRVHYTTDGSIPTASSPVYTEPLTFVETTVLRARIIADGMIPGNVMTESYFIDEAFDGHNLPVVSIVTDADNFWGKENGIYMQNFKPDWEVPVNIEMFLNNGSDRAAFNEAAGIKINGLYSWQLPQKMLGVYFKKRYGESKLAYQLFVDDERTSFDNFALRASGSDWSYTMMRDGLTQQAARRGDMNLDLMAFRPCVVYVNGEFLGVHNIREKVDKDYIKRHYDLGGADIDMIEGGDTPEEGTLEAWDKFFARMKSEDLSSDETFADVTSEMDVENFTDYIISQSYSANTSLDHNTMVWKTIGDGRWRWILMDTDRGFFHFDDSNIDYVVKQKFWPLKEMLQNEGYKAYFRQRLADQLFTSFNADEICRQIDEHERDIDPVMGKHVDRWLGTTSSYGNAMSSVSYWHNEVEELRDFARGRVSILLDDLSNYGAGRPALLSLSARPANACKLSFNGHALPQTKWGGLYPTDMDFTISAEARAGHRFAGWRQTTLTDLVGRGSTWRYLDDGSNQGDAWHETNYDDTSWADGKAPFGYGVSDIETKVSYGSSSSSKHITTYFRRHFQVDDVDNLVSVKLMLRREDAAAVYVNGRLVANSNLPINGLTYKTKALTTMYDYAAKTYLLYDIDPSYLHEGDNVIAVEVHQVSATSSDLIFDLQLVAETLDADSPMLDNDPMLALSIDGHTGLCAVYEETGESVLPDTIREDMTLYKNRSPYLAAGTVVVSENARLTIEPGVEVLFSPDADMIVHGALTAEGTAEDSITFRLNPLYGETASWGALCFINTADRLSTIRYAELRDGSMGPKEYNCVAVLSGFATRLELDHLNITRTYANPVACRYSDLRLTNSRLHSSITGDLVNVKYGRGYVADCELIGNDQVDTDAIDYDGVDGGVIERVIIHDFLGDNSDAIDIGEQAMEVRIDSVLVYDITDKGVSVGQRSTAIVTNSTFIQTNLGLGVKDSCRAEVDHCTFYAVRTPIASYEKVLGRGGGNVIVTSSVFADSFDNDVLCDERSMVSVRRSLSDTSELPYGADNTMADPEFVAPSLYDLRSESALLADCGAHFMPLHPMIQPIITELCYLQDETAGLTEYLVLTNVGTSDIDMGGYSFTQGITYTFPEGVVLPAGDSIYVVRSLGTFDTEAQQLQWESGKLADEGETIELTSPSGVTIDQVRYLPMSPWPVVGEGRSKAIELCDVLKANHLGANWQLKTLPEADAIKDIIGRGGEGKAYDLQGRAIDGKSARGLIIIDGRKVIRL